MFKLVGKVLGFKDGKINMIIGSFLNLTRISFSYCNYLKYILKINCICRVLTWEEIIHLFYL